MSSAPDRKRDKDKKNNKKIDDMRFSPEVRRLQEKIDELRRQVNEFLRTFREQGGFEKLGDEFLAEHKAYFKAHDIPFYF